MSDEITPYEAGRRAGFKGRDVSAAWYPDSQDWLDWYAGWRAGRDQAEAEIVERIGVQQEFAPVFRLAGRSA